MPNNQVGYGLVNALAAIDAVETTQYPNADVEFDFEYVESGTR